MSLSAYTASKLHRHAERCSMESRSERIQLMPLSTETHQALGLDRPQPVEVNGRSNLDIMKSLDHPGDAPYHPCPEAYPADDVPEGNLTKYGEWDGSDIYPGTRRDMYVYTPAGFDPASTARLIVFQDGYGYAARQGPVRATRVLDTRIDVYAHQPVRHLLASNFLPFLTQSHTRKPQ